LSQRDRHPLVDLIWVRLFEVSRLCRENMGVGVLRVVDALVLAALIR
jgi:hypothetical protein